MNATWHALLVFVHVLGVVVWVGGMGFAHFVLRPSAVQTLQPPQRLPLMAAALGRFFRIVTMAVVAIVISGAWVLLSVGWASAPRAWHVMLGTGLVMAGVFAWIYGRLYPRLRDAVAASEWPQAAAALDRIRRLVLFNLVLGVVTIAVAVSARA